MNNKYELTDQSKTVNGHVLHRIRALRDFAGVNAGDLGGWIEDEDNLSSEGNAWVCGNARVYGNAWVYGNARIDSPKNLLLAGDIGSRESFTSIYPCADRKIWVSCGCFFGTLDEFELKVRKTHGDNKFGKEYSALITLARIHFDLE